VTSRGVYHVLKRSIDWNGNKDPTRRLEYVVQLYNTHNVERRDTIEEAQILKLVYRIDDIDPYGLLVKKRRTIHMACWLSREGRDPSRGVRRRAPAAPLHWKSKASIQWRLSLLLLLS
jgi:hypothetical protein